MTNTMEGAPANTWAGFEPVDFEQVSAAETSALLRDKRTRAFSAYGALERPTRWVDEWRRTDPDVFPIGTLQRLPLIPRLPECPAAPWDDAFDVVVAVTSEGYAILPQNDRAESLGVTVCSLTEAAERFPDKVEQYLQGPALPATTGKFEALNDAFWNVGLFVHIPEKVNWERGVLIRYDMHTPDRILIPRLVVVAERNSRATVTERLTSPDHIAFMAIPGRELYVNDGAHVKLVSLQEWGLGSYQVANDWGLVQRDAQLNWITLNFGSARSKMKFGSDVAGPGSTADMDGIFFASGNQHMDQRTLQIHSSPDTYSRLLYKGAVKDKGRSVYQGLIIARPGAIRVDAYQTNNNLVLNEGARADSIPGLLIDADDLKCSHGSTTGNLDPEQLFYLRTRGLSEADARQALIEGFFQEVIDRIPQDFIRAHVLQRIQDKMEQ